MTNIKRAILAIFIAVFGVVGLTTGLVSAHANAVVGSSTCQDNGTYTVSWKISNDFNLTEHVTLVTVSGGGTLTGLPTDIAASPNQPYKFATATQTGVPGTAVSAALTVHGVWSDTFAQNDSGSTALAGTCKAVTTPGVTFTDPTCANQNTASVSGQLNTDKITYVTSGTVAPGKAVTVAATPKPGFTFPAPNPRVFTHTFTGAVDCTTHVTASVTFRDPTCANTSVEVIGATDTASIDFTINGTVAPGQSVTVTAVAKPTFTLDGTASWSHTFTNVPECRTVTEPVVTFTDPTCANNNAAGVTHGNDDTVDYALGTNSVIAPGGLAVVTATPKTGYRFAGEQQTLTFQHTFSAFDACPTTTTIDTTTTQPPAVCVYNTDLPADSPLCVAPTTTTIVTQTTVAPPVAPVLPATGRGEGGLILGGILLGAGIITTVVARRPKHV